MNTENMLLKVALLVFFLQGAAYCDKEKQRADYKVAIVGAGVGGASTAHFLRELFGKKISIDV